MANKSPVDPKNYTTDFVRSDYDNTSLLGNPHLDALTTALQAMGAEVWTTRRRLYVVEALMEKGIAVTPAAIQGYVPTPEEERRWKADRDRMVAGVYAPFLRAGEVTFPSARSESYDPHREPDIARRSPVTVGMKEGAPPEVHPAEYRPPLPPAKNSK